MMSNKTDQKVLEDLLKEETLEVKELKQWAKELKKAETDSDRDVLDRFEAYKFRKDCENVYKAKEQQIFAYMDIAKNIKKNQEEAKLKPVKP